MPCTHQQLSRKEELTPRVSVEALCLLTCVQSPKPEYTVQVFTRWSDLPSVAFGLDGPERKQHWQEVLPLTSQLDQASILIQMRHADCGRTTSNYSEFMSTAILRGKIEMVQCHNLRLSVLCPFTLNPCIIKPSESDLPPS